MKGNIGPTIKNTYIDPDNLPRNQKEILQRMADEFDIDKVIPKDERIQPSKAPEESQSI